MRFAASPAAFTAAKASPLYGAAVDTSASLPKRMMPMIRRLPQIALPLLALAPPLPAAAQDGTLGDSPEVLSDTAATDRLDSTVAATGEPTKRERVGKCV